MSQPMSQPAPQPSSHPASIGPSGSSWSTCGWSGDGRRTRCGPTAPTSTGLLAGLTDARRASTSPGCGAGWPTRTPPEPAGPRSRAGPPPPAPSPPGPTARGLLPADPGARLSPRGRVRAADRPRPRSRRPPCSTPPGARAEDGRRRWRCAIWLVLELLYATGVRVAELCGLDLDDVDEQSAFAARARQGRSRERTVVYGVPAARPSTAGSTAGRPAAREAPARRPPCCWAHAAGRLDPRVARASCTGRWRGAGRPGRRAARSTPRRSDAHDGGRRGPPLRTGVARSR